MKPAIFLLAILCPFLSMCQSFTIKGKIINENSEPVPSATITLQRTGQTTTADKNGNFTIHHSLLTDTLIVSAIGYQTVAEPNNERGLITITLRKKITQLQDVQISTGYQQLPKERATGSFSLLNDSLLSRTTSLDLLSRLRANVPGLLFDKNTGNSLGIIIRGTGTITTTSQPLIVLDNFPYYGDIRNINPNDIENITILRDAAAASIWGAAAGNGVIVISTRRAGFSQPPQLTVTSNITIAQKHDPFYTPAMSAPAFIEAETFLFHQGYYNAAASNTTTRPVLSPVVEILLQQRSGSISPALAAQRIDSLSRFDIRNDSKQYLLRPAVHSQQAIAWQGGSSFISGYIGLGFDNDLSSAVGNSYRRYTLTVKNTVKLHPRIRLGSFITYTQSLAASNNPGSLSPGGGRSSLYPYARLVDEQNRWLPVPKDYRMAYIDTAGGGRLLNWHYRPLEELHLADNNTRLQDMLIGFTGRITLASFLNTEISYQYGKQSSANHNHAAAETYFARNLINRFTQLSGNTIKYILPPGGILTSSQAALTTQNLRAQLNLSRRRNRHDYTALAGAEIRQLTNETSGYRSYGYNKDVLTTVNMDYATQYPVYGNLASAQRIPAALFFTGTVNRFVSVFANAAYTFNRKYTLSASARKDASNLYGVNINNKGIPLWSAGLAWDMAAENFYTLKWLPKLRLRLTYGFNGNTDNNRSAYSTISYVSSADPLTNLSFATISNLPNAALRWERTGILNAAVDFASANDRITGSFEYYRKSALDLLAAAPVDPTLGFTFQVLNSAGIRGRGFDLQLNTLNTRGRINWSSNLLLACSRNTIATYRQELLAARFYVGNGNTLNPIVGKDAYALFSYRWAGLDPATGEPRGWLNDTISKNYTAIRNAPVTSLVYHGSAVPLYFGSLRNNINWKNFSLSATILFKLRYWFRRSSVNYNALASSWTTHNDYDRRWQKPGDENFTAIPAFIYPLSSIRDEIYAYAEINAVRGDHFRLQDIRLSYDWQPKQKNKNPFKSITLFLFADNIGLLWKANKYGIDPDYFSGALPASCSMAIGGKLTL